MEQQQETWKLPEAFVARMKAMLGDACDTFLASYEKERAAAGSRKPGEPSGTPSLP